MGMIFDIFGDNKAHRDFLALRYIEDIGYDAFVRQQIFMSNPSPLGFNKFDVDGPHGKVAKMAQDLLQQFASQNLNNNQHNVKVTDCYLPWSRLFEAGITVDVS